MKGTMSRTWRLALTLVLAFTMLGTAVFTSNHAAAQQATWILSDTDQIRLDGPGFIVRGEIKWHYTRSGLRRGTANVTFTNTGTTTQYIHVGIWIGAQSLDGYCGPCEKKTATPRLAPGRSATLSFISFGPAASVYYNEVYANKGSNQSQAQAPTYYWESNRFGNG